jgi:hypothetical protein
MPNPVALGKVLARLLDLRQQCYEMEKLKVEKQLNIIPPDTEQIDFL